jgi:hypothetical protein
MKGLAIKNIYIYELRELVYRIAPRSQGNKREVLSEGIHKQNKKNPITHNSKFINNYR